VAARYITSLKKMVVLAMCEPFHPALFGQDAASTPGIEGQFLVQMVVDPRDFLDDAYGEELELWKAAPKTDKPHPVLRNYARVHDHMVGRLELVDMQELTPGGEAVAVVKTTWLRQVQRKWRSRLAARRAEAKRQSHPHALAHRALFAKRMKK
jgi:hypothetical protein